MEMYKLKDQQVKNAQPREADYRLTDGAGHLAELSSDRHSRDIRDSARCLQIVDDLL